MVKNDKNRNKVLQSVTMAINTSQLEVIVVEETSLWSTHRCGVDIGVERTSVWTGHRWRNQSLGVTDVGVERHRRKTTSAWNDIGVKQTSVV